jgi:uncharacterized membrane protein
MILLPGSALPLVLSIVGPTVAGWLGGELVYVHRVGVAAARSAPRKTARGTRTA